MALTSLPTAESRARDGSDITDPSLVSKGLVTPDEGSRYRRLECSYDWCGSKLAAECLSRIRGAGTGHEISSLYINEPGILTPIFHSISGVHVCIVQQLLLVPFRSGFYSFPVLCSLIPSLVWVYVCDSDYAHS